MRWVAGLLLSSLFLITLSIGQQAALDWYHNGINLSRHGEFEEAVWSFDKAIGLNPQNAGAWQEKGKALMGLNKYNEAVWAFNNATRIDSLYVEAWFSKGDALSKIGNNTEAMNAYHKVIQLGLTDSTSEMLAIKASRKIGYIEGKNDNRILFEERTQTAFIYSVIPIIIALALFAAIWRHKDEQRRLLWISLLYADILILVIGVVSILVWDQRDPIIAYVPTPILEWAFIGAVVAVLYQLATRENTPGTRLYLWIIAKPIVGLSMGALVYFIALGGSILLGNPSGKELPSNTIYWLCALAFVGGFSDKFSMDLMDRFVSTSIKEEDTDVIHQN